MLHLPVPALLQKNVNTNTRTRVDPFRVCALLAGEVATCRASCLLKIVTRKLVCRHGQAPHSIAGDDSRCAVCVSCAAAACSNHASTPRFCGGTPEGPTSSLRSSSRSGPICTAWVSSVRRSCCCFKNATQASFTADCVSRKAAWQVVAAEAYVGPKGCAPSVCFLLVEQLPADCAAFICILH